MKSFKRYFPITFQYIEQLIRIVCTSKFYCARRISMAGNGSEITSSLSEELQENVATSLCVLRKQKLAWRQRGKKMK